MSFSSGFIDEELRRALRLQLQFTIPAEFVEPVVDIACHAVEQSLDTLERIAFNGADHRVSISATSMAVSLLLHRLQHMKQAMEDVARENGMPVLHATVRVGA